MRTTRISAICEFSHVGERRFPVISLIACPYTRKYGVQRRSKGPEGYGAAHCILFAV